MASRGKQVSVHQELALVKAAVLYADTVEVLSLGSQFVSDLSAFATGDPRTLWQLLGNMDDAVLRHLAPSMDVDAFRRMLPILATDPTQMQQGLAALGLERDAAPLLQLMAQADQQASSTMTELRQLFDQMKADSGVGELEAVLDRGLVRFNERVVIGEDTGAVVTSFVDELTRYLLDPNKFLLVDAETASMVRALVREGRVTPPSRSLANAGEAVVGTGLVARLPAFPTAPLEELIHLRGDLSDPLSRYRRKVSELRQHLQTDPFDEHVEAEVAALWRSHVDPELVGIREAMAEHTVVKDILRTLGTNASDLAKGVLMPAMLTVGTASLADLGTAVTVGLTAAATSTSVAAQAAVQRRRSLSDIRRGDLFYLYEVDRRLSDPD